MTRVHWPPCSQFGDSKEKKRLARLSIYMDVILGYESLVVLLVDWGEEPETTSQNHSRSELGKSLGKAENLMFSLLNLLLKKEKMESSAIWCGFHNSLVTSWHLRLLFIFFQLEIISAMWQEWNNWNCKNWIVRKLSGFKKTPRHKYNQVAMQDLLSPWGEPRSKKLPPFPKVWSVGL